MFHTFLHPISDFSGGASAAVGIALPPIAVITTAIVDFEPFADRSRPAKPASTSTTLESWLDNLPVRGWDA
jgi:hypothetical protein